MTAGRAADARHTGASSLVAPSRVPPTALTPRQTARTDGGRDVGLRPGHPGPRRIGRQGNRSLRQVCDRRAQELQMPTGQPRPISAHGSAAKARGQRVKRHPPLP